MDKKIHKLEWAFLPIAIARKSKEFERNIVILGIATKKKNSHKGKLKMDLI